VKCMKCGSINVKPFEQDVVASADVHGQEIEVTVKNYRTFACDACGNEVLIREQEERAHDTICEVAGVITTARLRFVLEVYVRNHRPGESLSAMEELAHDACMAYERLKDVANRRAFATVKESEAINFAMHVMMAND